MTMNFKISWTLQKFLISLNSILTNSYNTWLTHFVHMSFYLPVAKLPQKQCYLNGQEIFISCPEVPCEWGEHLNGALIFLFVLFSLKWGLPCMKRARSVRSFMSIFKKLGFFFFLLHSWPEVGEGLRSKCIMDEHSAPGLRLEVTHKFMPQGA